MSTPYLHHIDVHLPRARLAVADLWRPIAFEESRKPRFRATLLVSVTDPAGLKIVEELMEAATTLWRRANPGNPAATLPRPLLTPGNARRDKAGKVLFGYAMTAVINASAAERPTLLGTKGTALRRDDGSLRPGDFVHAILRLQAYTQGGHPGVYAELRGLKHLGMGEKVGFIRRDDAKVTEVDFEIAADDAPAVH